MKKALFAKIILILIMFVLLSGCIPDMAVNSPSESGSSAAGDKSGTNSRKVIVLMYHHLLEEKDITGPWENNNAVLPVEIFDEQMQYLSENEYNTITLTQLKDFLYNGDRLPDRPVLITFDDGYKSNAQYAYSILKKYDFNAVIFLITSMIQDKKEEFDPVSLQFISKEELEECKDVFEYGSHTDDFHKKENGKAYMKIKSEAEIIADTEKSLEKLTAYDPMAFAYPYGIYSNKSRRVINRKYDLVFLNYGGLTNEKTDPYDIKRYKIASMEDFTKVFKR